MTTSPASPTRQPALFLGHGSPMNAIEDNRHSRAWAELGEELARNKPAAIVAVSAHWYGNMTAVTAMPDPRTIHDFYGFPKELFDVEYRAPGSPELAERIGDVLKPDWVGQDRDSWGLDHGTWSVLKHLMPDADVPVVQLSINAEKPLDYHLELGRKLSALRDEGVLMLGSGNVVHNLRAVDWGNPGGGFDWADRFDDAAREVMLTDPSTLGDLRGHRDWRLAVPTPDHFLPLAYVAGAAGDHAGAGDGASPGIGGGAAPGGDGSVGRVRVIDEGRAMGSLSMTGYLYE